MTVIQTFMNDPLMLILGFFITVIFIKEVISLKDWFCTQLGIETKTTLHQKAIDEKLDQYGKRLESLDQRLKDDIQDEVAIKDKLNVLADMITEMQARNDDSTRSRLKDRIAQSYRHYHLTQKWTAIEKEAFEDLIASYENAGGKNSFVHTLCQPESYTWEVVEDSESRDNDHSEIDMAVQQNLFG